MNKVFQENAQAAVSLCIPDQNEIQLEMADGYCRAYRHFVLYFCEGFDLMRYAVGMVNPETEIHTLVVTIYYPHNPSVWREMIDITNEEIKRRESSEDSTHVSSQ